VKAFPGEGLHKYSSRVKSGSPVASEVDVDRCNEVIEGERRVQIEAVAVAMAYTTKIVGMRPSRTRRFIAQLQP
jgi:hypothetical protein